MNQRPCGDSAHRRLDAQLAEDGIGIGEEGGITDVEWRSLGL